MLLVPTGTILQAQGSHTRFRVFRQAEEAEAKALAAKDSASAAVRGARQAGVRLRGKDSEAGIADLHAVAAARLAGWSAWVASRNSMDNSFKDNSGGEVGSTVHLALPGHDKPISHFCRTAKWISVPACANTCLCSACMLSVHKRLWREVLPRSLTAYSTACRPRTRGSSP